MTSINYIFSIGIDKYESPHWKNLNNAVLDGKELTKVLVDKYSFENYPENLYDGLAKKSEIYTAFNSLNQVATENDRVIIFFAGHGNMDYQTKRGFWIPTDGTNDRFY
jgi:uncharacterized caspase-like protein